MANRSAAGGIAGSGGAGGTDEMVNGGTLRCGSLPRNVFGYVIAGQTRSFGANPAGSAGNLCVGGQIGRYAGNILQSGTSGSVSLMIDLNNMPAPTASYAVMPGDTVNFQFWHRDASPMGATSNFSEGLEIQFDSVQSGPTFELDVYPLLVQDNIGAPSCVTCHGGICGLDLGTAQDAFDNLVNVQSSCCFPDIHVVPGDPDASVLFQKLGTPACGQPMPLGGTFAGDANVIRDWILAGAPF